jgi:ankyrin repeat protein
MKRLLLILFFGAGWLVQGADSQLAPLIQQGLFEEEANRNLPAAIQAYEAALREFDKDRNLAATAVFRLAECFRKQGRTNEAATLYGRVTREFSDQAHLVSLSSQSLASLGAGSASPGESKPNESLVLDPERQETQRIMILIRNSPDLINAPNDSGETLLQKAASQGNLETVRLLLTNSAAVNGLKEGDHTALHFASFRGHNAMVELLLANGANPNASTMSGVTPLHLAAMRGYEAVVKTLLAHKALPNVVGRASEPSGPGMLIMRYYFASAQTPLQLAAQNGFAGVAAALLGAGAEIDAEDGNGRTALGLAAREGHVAMVKLLLEAKANPNGGRREPPLHAACSSGNLEALRLLLQAGADANFEPPGSRGYPPLCSAIQRNFVEGVKLLCEYKANPNVPGPTAEGSPIIFLALGNPEILKVLLKGGANPNVLKDPKTRTSPLHSAAAEPGKEEQLKLLLAAKADVNAVDSQGRTPLHACVPAPAPPPPNVERQTEAECLAKMKELLAHGANVNARDIVGNSPLHLACYALSRPVIELLLANKADPNMLNAHNESPLDMLKREAGQRPSPGSDAPSIAKDLIEVLRKAGASEDIPRMDRIMIRPSGASQSEVLFTTNLWSSGPLSGHTLLQAFAVRYGILGLNEGGGQRRPQPGAYYVAPRGFPFPDLANVRLMRPTPDWTNQTFDITAILTNNCAGDVPLQWGDVIEIPERPHGIAENWGGLPSALNPLFAKCLACEVKVSIHGRTNMLSLGPKTNGSLLISGGPMWLKSALKSSGLLLSTSDLERVKVRRPSENKDWVINCSESAPDPAFWLRDGDEIEVVEKSK